MCFYILNPCHQGPCNMVGSLSLVEHQVGFEPETFQFWLQLLNPCNNIIDTDLKKDPSNNPHTIPYKYWPVKDSVDKQQWLPICCPHVTIQVWSILDWKIKVEILISNQQYHNLTIEKKVVWVNNSLTVYINLYNYLYGTKG